MAQAGALFNIIDGIKLYNKEDFETSKIFFEEYVLNNPNDKEGYYYLAKTLLELDQTTAAKASFKKAYELTLKEENLEKINIDFQTNVNLEDYFDMATMFFDDGNLKEADYYCDMMLKISPNSPSAYFIKAKIAHKKGEKEKAKEYLNKAIIFNNDLLETNLAKLLDISEIPDLTKETYNIFALEAYYKGDTDSAIKYFEKYLELEINNYEIYNKLANLYIQKNDLDNALLYITEGRKINPNSIKNYLLEIEICYLKGEEDKIEQLLQKAYKINPNNEEILFETGNYYLNKEDYSSAKKYFETLITMNDAFFEAYSGYIYSLIETKEIEKALGQIKKLKALNPKSSEIPYFLARICEYQGCFSDALDYINEAISKSKNPKYYFEAANISYILKSYEKSLNYLNKLKKLPYSSFSKDEISELETKNYIKLRKYENAQNILNNELDLDKKSIMYKYNLYVLYKFQGDERKAQDYLVQATKTKPVTPSQYIDFSEIVLETKGLEAALKLLDKAIKTYPEQGKLYLGKIKCCILANNLKMLEYTLKESNTTNHPKE